MKVIHRVVKFCFFSVLLLIGWTIAGQEGVARRLAAEETLTIAVRETVGIARFSYPVRVALDFARPVDEQDHLRLLQDGKPLTAQFRPRASDKPSRRWWVDFNISVPPYGLKKLTVQHGESVSDGPLPRRGHELSEDGKSIRIANKPYITWTVSKDLRGFLQSVHFPPLEHVAENSPGLLIYDKQGKSHQVGGDSLPVAAEVERQGPLAVALRFRSVGPAKKIKGVRNVIDLYFPVSKSWVEVDWRIEDPQGNISAAEAALTINLDPPTSKAPTLVDFGATSMVYATLRKGVTAMLAAGAVDPAHPPRYQWEILRGPRRNARVEEGVKALPYVQGPRHSERKVQPEGWVHLMDRKRCLALAAADFGRHGRDEIRVDAEGAVGLRRTFVQGPPSKQGLHQGSKRLRFWMHFVGFPPQHSAATSPQSMQNSLKVSVLGQTGER